MQQSKRPLTIAYVDLDDVRNPLLAGGQATATYQVGQRLAKKGHRVIVLCSRYPGAQDRVEKGIEYRHIGLSTSNIKLNNFLFFLAAPWAVFWLRGADVILECFTAPASTLFSPLVTSTPVIAIPSMFNAKEFTHKYKLPFHWIEAIGVRFYKYMMPYSDIDSQKAKRLNPKITVRIIPQGVGQEYADITHTKAKHILYLGRFDVAQKGIDLLLEAYALAKDRITYPLVIAGHGPDEARIRQQIEQLGLSDAVTIVGSAYGDKKMKLMAESHIVAFPSRHDEICLWTLEALAAGLPLVAFDIPESRWISDDVALKAKPFDVATFADQLVEASKPKTRKKMSAASRQFAKKYSWENVVDQMEEFMYSVISERTE